MKQKICLSILVTSLLLNAASVNAENLQDQQGQQGQKMSYKNQRGSTLSLVWHAEGNNSGTLSGTFITAVGSCKSDVGVPLPVSGFYNGNAVVISVNFPHCKHVIAMAGHAINENKEMELLWLGAQPAKDPTGQNWNATLAGTDHYTQNN